MINIRKTLIVTVATLLFFNMNYLIADDVSIDENTAKDEFNIANEFYQNKQYQDAIDTYSILIENGKQTAEIYFNLGNCYYKVEDYTSAILNYERSKRLDPSLKDVDFNLKLSNMQIVDKIKPIPELFLFRWYHNLSNFTNSTGWGVIIIVMIWLTIVLVLGFIFLSSPNLKRFSFTLAALCLIFTAIAFIIGSEVKQSELSHDSAIIFTESVFIKSSPDSESKNLFLLHNGTKVTIHDELNDWYKIKIADGNDGWIQKSEIVKI